MKILLVEDEDTLRRVIGRLLRGLGYDVVEASSGEQALELFRNEPFPLVFTDIVMGGMSGLELLENITMIDSDTLTIVVTSHASVAAATTALRSGAYDFLIKPFEDLDVITSVVERAAEKIRITRENRRLLERLSASASEQEALNRQLKELAVRDGLTGLYNHRHFRDALDAEIARSERHTRSFAVCFCDLDHFKKYNDTHGHLMGDEALKAVAEVICKTNRRTTIAARYGGEEFVLLLPETDQQGAAIIAEKMRDEIARHPFPARESQPRDAMTVSIGVAAYPEDGSSATELIAAADRAMYEVKQRGGNGVSCASRKETVCD